MASAEQDSQTRLGQRPGQFDSRQQAGPFAHPAAHFGQQRASQDQALVGMAEGMESLQQIRDAFAQTRAPGKNDLKTARRRLALRGEPA